MKSPTNPIIYLVPGKFISADFHNSLCWVDTPTTSCSWKHSLPYLFCHKSKDLKIFLVSTPYVLLPHHSRLARNWYWIFGVERVEERVGETMHLWLEWQVTKLSQNTNTLHNPIRTRKTFSKAITIWNAWSLQDYFSEESTMPALLQTELGQLAAIIRRLT